MAVKVASRIGDRIEVVLGAEVYVRTCKLHLDLLASSSYNLNRSRLCELTYGLLDVMWAEGSKEKEKSILDHASDDIGTMAAQGTYQLLIE